jgi:uncharacterized membrane protein YdjX (TVP38/TMEM64 family)
MAWLADKRMKQDSGGAGLSKAVSGRLLHWRLIVLALIVVAIPVGLAFGVDGEDGLAIFREHQFTLLGLVAGKPILTSLGFMLIYGAAVAVSLPGVSVLTMIGGYLFGWMHGTVVGLLAATIATTAVFVFARGTLADVIRARAGSSIGRFTERFQQHAFRYTFLLHLVPVFPYGMVVAVPAACGVRLPTYVVGAFLGFLPATALLAHLGEEVGYLLLSSRSIELSALLQPDILAAAAGVLALSLLPLGFRRFDPRRLG